MPAPLPSASDVTSDPAALANFLSSLEEDESDRLPQEWNFWARPEQLAPGGQWTTWLYMGGRGAGKTRAGAEWISDRVARGLARRIALVGSTAADARDVMVEGQSGLLSVSPSDNLPKYEPSKRRLTWRNGAMATLYSAEEPNVLRGPQHDTAWCDELAKWKHLEAAWDNLQFGLRLGERPQQVITTTPQALAALKAIIARSDTIVSRGTSYDNRANLPGVFFTEIIKRYEGTRTGRQEIEAELLDDVAGALWTRATLDAARLKHGEAPPQLVRVVVGVDPSGTRGEDDDRASVGIVAAGKGIDGLAYVLADFTCSLSPAGWGRHIAECVSAHKADCVVAEGNFGGAMVESVLKAANVGTRVKMVTASRGKAVRAEPVAALYEQNRVKHAGAFSALEDQLVSFTPEGYVGQGSPDRADAMIWALTELMLAPGGEQGWLEYMERELKRKGL
ncbi:MAG TPA: terminase family protein [Rhizomicrobium sp.]|jgi:phage terminase large subunit-like protein